MRLLLLVTHYWERGGIEAYVKDLERACRQLGANVDVLSISGGWISVDKKGHSGLQADRARLTWLSKASFIARIAGAGLTRKYDAVLCAHPFISIMPWVWRKLGGPPYLVFAYGMEVWSRLRWHRRWGLIGADRAVTISRYTAQRLAEDCHVSPSQIRILPPSLPGYYLTPIADDAARTAAKRRWSVVGRKVILTVGRQMLSENYKGADLLIRAVPAISRTLGDVSCVVAGGGDALSALEQLAADVGVASQVQILGPVSDPELLSLYDACDIFVLPSKKEGFGIVFLEAAARGRPSVGLRLGGIEDALLGGRLGILVDRDDPLALADAVTRVLNGDGPAEFTDQQELRRIAVENFGFDRFSSRLGNILGEVLPRVSTVIP